MLDIITIHHLETPTTIGTYPFERTTKQTLLINTHFTVQSSKIAKNDDINTAIDYDKLSQSILQFGLNTNYFLLETFAHNLAKHLLANYPLTWLKLEITKPTAIKNAKGVTITIEREGTQHA